MPSVDLIEMFLSLADKYGMKFYFGLYDSGHYWDTGDMSWEMEDNKYVIEELQKTVYFWIFAVALYFWFSGCFFHLSIFRSQTDIPEIIDYGVQYLNICCVFSFGLFLEFPLKSFAVL